MDKILARALRAKNQAARKAKKVKEYERRGRLQDGRRQHTMYQNLLAQEKRTWRAEEKEDRLLGPLRPQRAVGKEFETYGALSRHHMPPPVPDEHKIKYWNITVDDRVVILKGPDRHKIGRVKSIDRQTNHLMVEGLNMVPMKPPAAYAKLQPDSPAAFDTEWPIHYNDVRLVQALRDPVTGSYRDTIIANISMSPVIHDRHARRTRWRRLIAGTDTVIPWPQTPPKQHLDQPADTRIMDVETETYQPKLLSAPFPGGVIDELRNKYGRYRTRHDAEYVAKVEAEAEAERVKAGSMVRTPLQELNRRMRLEKKAMGRPEIGVEVLERIGKVMAEKRPELVEVLQQQQQQQQVTV